MNDYTSEVECIYKGRKYYVRDNGAIYRHCQTGSKPSKWDMQWTFGKYDTNTGYMLIAQERVHRIVCTAFHGEPVGDRNVVDHIDTNHSNNRPTNLRWVTKLENTLNNPITRAKVELICGSIEAFLKNPRLLDCHTSDHPSFSWMRTVSKEEAERSLKRWNEWAKKPITARIPKGEGAGEWIYSIEPKHEQTKQQGYEDTNTRSVKGRPNQANKSVITIPYEESYDLKNSLTPGAKQLDWKTPTEFPQIPSEISDTPLIDYLSMLTKGTLFCRNEYSKSMVFDAAISEDQSHLAVLTEYSGVTKYALCEVSFANGFFIHRSVRSFFTEQGANKYFTLSLGKEWNGGDFLEDFC